MPPDRTMTPSGQARPQPADRSPNLQGGRRIKWRDRRGRAGHEAPCHPRIPSRGHLSFAAAHRHGAFPPPSGLGSPKHPEAPVGVRAHPVRARRGADLPALSGRQATRVRSSAPRGRRDWMRSSARARGKRGCPPAAPRPVFDHAGTDWERRRSKISWLSSDPLAPPVAFP